MSDLAPLYAELRDYAGRQITFKELGAKARKKLGSQSMDRVMDELVIGANEMRNDIIQSMRNTPKTGKLYFKYNKYGKNKKGQNVKKAIFHRASSPGNPPAVDTGDLLRSIIVDARWSEVEVGSIITDPAYPLELEKGASKRNLLPRPWLEPARRRNEPRIKMAVRRVMRQIAAEMSE